MNAFLINHKFLDKLAEGNINFSRTTYQIRDECVVHKHVGDIGGALCLYSCTTQVQLRHRRVDL